jgi:serine/threonine protein kinase
MLTGFLPFYEKNPTLLFEKIRNGEYNWEGCPEVSQHAKNFVGMLLTVNPQERLTAVEALEHEWIASSSSSQRASTSTSKSPTDVLVASSMPHRMLEPCKRTKQVSLVSFS